MHAGSFITCGGDGTIERRQDQRTSVSVGDPAAPSLLIPCPSYTRPLLL